MNVGLDKLRETEAAVMTLMQQLSVYEKTLNEKNKAADERLKKMMQEQKQAEVKKEIS